MIFNKSHFCCISAWKKWLLMQHIRGMPFDLKNTNFYGLLSKAFVTIDHEILIQIIDLSWIIDKSYTRKQYVAFEFLESTKLEISFGVPKSSIYWAPFFLIYIRGCRRQCHSFCENSFKPVHWGTLLLFMCSWITNKRHKRAFRCFRYGAR